MRWSRVRAESKPSWTIPTEIRSSYSSPRLACRKLGSANSANSEMAGQTGARVIRKRTFVVATGFSRTSLQLPMLVPRANSRHSLFFQMSTANASTRCPSGRYSRRRTTLNVCSRRRLIINSGVFIWLSVVQYVSRLRSITFRGENPDRVLLALTWAPCA